MKRHFISGLINRVTINRIMIECWFASMKQNDTLNMIWEREKERERVVDLWISLIISNQLLFLYAHEILSCEYN